jgi:hypothetical protein
LLGNERGGLLWLNPLPPFGTTYVAQSLPLSLSEEGVLSFAAQSQPPLERYPAPEPRCLAWDEVGEVASADRDVIVGGRPFVSVGSADLAAHVARLLRELARDAPKARERRLAAEVERAFDTVAIASALEKAERETQGLVWLQTSLLLACFVLLPWMLEYERLSAWWGRAGDPVLLDGDRGADLGHRHAPRARATLAHSAAVLLHPFPAMRARDALLRDTLATQHPLAVAKVLCSEDEFAAVFAAALRDARARRTGRSVRWRMSVPCASRRAWRARIERALARLAPRLAERARAPERLEDCLAYCARCEKQYTRLDTSLRELRRAAAGAFPA